MPLIMYPYLLLVVALAVPVASQAQEDELHKSFLRAQGARFTVLFEGPQDEQLALRAAEILDESYERLGRTLGIFPQRTVTVILYTEQQFRDITRAPAWAAAAYDGRIRVPVRGALEHPAELERVLAHELAHAMIESVAPRGLPFWLAEGLAVALEPDGGARTVDELARTHDRLPFERLARSFRGLSPDEARLAYAQSAAMARLLLHEAGAPTVVAILGDLAAGRTFESAYEQRLSLPFDAFRRSLHPELR